MDAFITAGAGDFVAIVSFLTDIEKAGIKRIFYATRAEKLIRFLTPFIFPNLEAEITVCNDFTPSEEINENPWKKELVDKFCVHDLDDLIERFPLLVDKSELKNCIDLSLSKVAQLAIDGKRAYNPPREILQQKLAGVDNYSHLPYMFIHPWSDNQRYEERDLNELECMIVKNYLEKRKWHGIIINQSKELFPIKSEFIIDNTNKYNFLQCIEMLKNAKLGFIGTASVFSVIAAKLFPPDNIIIKGSDTLRIGWHLFYYRPHKWNYFIHPNLKFLN